VFADLVCGFVRELTMVLLTDLFNTPPAGTARGKEQENRYYYFFYRNKNWKTIPLHLLNPGSLPAHFLASPT